MRRPSFLYAVGLVLVTCTLALDAGAFCRTRVDGTAARIRGDAPDQDGCYGVGREIYWPNQCISYQLYSSAQLVALSELRQVVAGAFAKWTLSSCALTEEEANANPASRVSLDVRDLGNSDCPHAGKKDPDQPGYNKTGPNQNLIVFRDGSWPYKNDDPNDPNLALGVTTATYDTETGVILDADIELNSFEVKIKAHDVTSDDYDLANILTHEVGHFLGIGHSLVEDSTMYLSAPLGETRKQFLKLDDLHAICTTYPPSSPAVRVSGPEPILALACDPRPAGGAQRTCNEDESGCSVGTPGRSSKLPLGAVGLLALGALGLGAKRRAARRKKRRRSRKARCYSCR